MLKPRKTIVVTGPPRSGTSLAMQMLATTGIEVISDGQRQHDRDNPRGYFEHEGVMRLAQDVSILENSAGKAIKIIHALLKYIPRDKPLAVLLLHRNLDEVLASQSAMLERLGRPAPSMDRSKMREVLAKQLAVALQGLKERSETEVLEIQHHDLIAEPETIALTIANFLEPHLDSTIDIQAMADCVDSTLYRQRC